MTMTLAVYRVDREGNRHLVRGKREVVPLKVWEAVSAYPPCRCPQHREGRKQ